MRWSINSKHLKFKKSGFNLFTNIINLRPLEKMNRHVYIDGYFKKCDGKYKQALDDLMGQFDGSSW